MIKWFELLCLALVLTLIVGCKEKNTIDDNHLIVAASQTPHAEILEAARSYIENQGYKFTVKVFNDYVVPNEVTYSGEVDANFFQHQPYLDDYNSFNNTSLVPVLSVHYEPLGLYKGRRDNLNDLNNAKIAIANDNSNGARGLLLLQDLGIITLNLSQGTVLDVNKIVSNPYNVEIIELEAAVIPSQLVDVDFAVINGNYALEAKISQEKLLEQEAIDSTGALLYANIIAVKAGNENNEAIKVLVEALQQKNIRDFINKTYNGVVVPLT
jgi:D-methionine transport system substrate-binding protein